MVVSSRGGIHQGETTDAVTPHLRAVLGLMGIQEVEFIYAEGAGQSPAWSRRRDRQRPGADCPARRSGLSRGEIVLALAAFLF